MHQCLILGLNSNCKYNTGEPDLFFQRVVLKCTVYVRQLWLKSASTFPKYLSKFPSLEGLFLHVYVCVCLCRGPHPALPCFCVRAWVCLSCVLTNGGMFWPTVAASDLPRTGARGCERGRWGRKGVWDWEERWGEREWKWPVPTSMVWIVFTAACVCNHKFLFLIICSRNVWRRLPIDASSLKE